ncbi:hypothetical protein HB364_17465 [Pseudoflavitalea sp. X16]|uniref:hypothetical protein n=1 Tax=Paraflavitalea devenefica TaxID=2716334 RepID=UPI00141F1180|nr:hypothetical protein [Paraflavitalea devenefica]NII26883.1 hypothetical protein [Paraflavitalea devenefica]
MFIRQTIFILLAILAFLLVFVTFREATSVIPGWHTTIYVGPSWYHFIFPALLLMISILYRRIIRRGVLVSGAFFTAHVLFTIITYLISAFGITVYFLFFNDYDSYMERILLVINWGAPWLLCAGQMIFVIPLWLKLSAGRSSRLGN